MIRLQNSGLSRALHDQLYSRMLSFCKKYTDEEFAEPVVNIWLQRMYLSDPMIHVLVNLNGLSIIEHAVIEVQEQVKGKYVIMCHQACRDKSNLKTLTEGLQYLDTLQQAYKAPIYFFVEDNAKAYAKLGNYKVVRYMLSKPYEKTQEEVQSDVLEADLPVNGI